MIGWLIWVYIQNEVAMGHEVEYFFQTVEDVCSTDDVWVYCTEYIISQLPNINRTVNEICECDSCECWWSEGWTISYKRDMR